MAVSGLSGIFTRGVSRRILGLFLIAAILPVIFTAFLAYNEIGRGLEGEVKRNLREQSKAYGVEIMERLGRASDKAATLVNVVEQEGVAAIEDRQYLLHDFEAVWLITPTCRFLGIAEL